MITSFVSVVVVVPFSFEIGFFKILAYQSPCPFLVSPGHPQVIHTYTVAVDNTQQYTSQRFSLAATTTSEIFGIIAFIRLKVAANERYLN